MNFFFLITFCLRLCDTDRRGSGTSGPRFLAHPPLRGSERRGGFSQFRRSFFASLTAGRSAGDGLRGTYLEGSALGTFHLGRRRCRYTFRGRSSGCHLPRQCRQSEMAQENTRFSNDIVPQFVHTSRHGKKLRTLNALLLFSFEIHEFSAIHTINKTVSSLSFLFLSR